MRIAQVSPLWERVPPLGYGGIELVVCHLTDELVRRGHDVTLFASGDSETLARLESVVSKPLRLNPTGTEPIVYELFQLEQLVDRAEEFDLINFHVGFPALPYGRLIKTPLVHTLHGPFSEDNSKLFEIYSDQNYISISNAQRQGGPQLNYTRTVYNGIDVEAYSFHAQPQNPPYLAFLGRLSLDKGPLLAIEIAKRAGWTLKMAGKVDSSDRRFYEEEVAPLIDGEQIQYLGELGHEAKAELLGNASAMLFPIAWPEPFGLVMIESMCTGTPVIGMKMGSVPEVIAHKKTGMICSTVEEAIAAIPVVLELERQHCRDYVEEFFSVAKMTDGYEAAYRQILEETRTPCSANPQPSQRAA